jgi:NAD(P)-dependent dehydrogenase (short-subunit alcohol dehydrogenase family)
MDHIEEIPVVNPKGRLAGKVVMVIGAGSTGPGWGLGRAATALFAREGAQVFAIDLDRAAVEETRHRVVAAGGICESVVADATRLEDLSKAVEACVGRFGRIDVLHHNVGGGGQTDAVTTSQAAWQASLDLNLTSGFLACKCVLPIMLAQGKGSIIHVGSIAAVRYPGTSTLAYSVAKAGLLQMSKSIALQYARSGIRSNYLVLGHVDTPEIRRRILDRFGADRFDEVMSARANVTPAGRPATVWDVANAAVFLASDESAYITGAELPVDGGVLGMSVESYLQKVTAKSA